MSYATAGNMDAWRRAWDEQQEAYRQLAEEAAPGPCSLSSTPANASDALAVHPRQVKEATESAKRRGVPVEFLPDGRPVFHSRAQKKAYLRAYGFHNRDACYGD